MAYQHKGSINKPVNKRKRSHIQAELNMELCADNNLENGGGFAIKKLVTSTPKAVVPTADPNNSESPWVLGKCSVEEQRQQQEQQQMSRHPEQQANRMMTDSSIPQLITPGFTQMGSVVSPNNQNSDLNQEASLQKWCMDIFGITCVRSIEGNCPGNCKLSHEIHHPGEIRKTLSLLNTQLLKHTYLFVKRYQIIFEKTVKVFLNTYASRKEVNEILIAIDDCVHYPNCCEKFLVSIRNSLMHCGYSAPNACLEILKRIFNKKSISESPDILDAIVDLIMSSGWIHMVDYVITIMNVPNYKLPPCHQSTILDEAIRSDNIDHKIREIIETLWMFPK